MATVDTVTVDPIVLSKIIDIIDNEVYDQNMFTAYDIMQNVREAFSGQLYYSVYRDEIHRLMQSYITYSSYSKTLREIDGDKEAFVYHHVDDNPYDYSIDIDTPLDTDFGVDSNDNIEVTVHSHLDTSNIYLDGSNISNLYRKPNNATVKSDNIKYCKIGSRGDICIPKDFVSKIKNSLSKISVYESGSKLVLSSDPKFRHDFITSYTVDSSGNIRVTRKALDKIGIAGKPIINVTLYADRIEIG